MKACLLALLGALLCACHSISPPAPVHELWQVSSLVGNSDTLVEGNPQVVESQLGRVVRFDGNGDRLLVDKNPLAGAAEFTIEIIFNPVAAYPANAEPRFFHIEAMDNPDRRVTVELRLNNKNQWYLDAYIKSEASQLTLIDQTLIHPIGQWAHAAITYGNREFVSYVNGKKELMGQVDYLPIAAHAKTSIGARINRVHWFKGEIALVRISHRVLPPDEFLRVEPSLGVNFPWAKPTR